VPACMCRRRYCPPWKSQGLSPVSKGLVPVRWGFSLTVSKASCKVLCCSVILRHARGFLITIWLACRRRTLHLFGSRPPGVCSPSQPQPRPHPLREPARKLQLYTDLAAGMGKPFIVEEFGEQHRQCMHSRAHPYCRRLNKAAQASLGKIGLTSLTARDGAYNRSGAGRIAGIKSWARSCPRNRGKKGM
jgi:hypothetical protein